MASYEFRVEYEDDTFDVVEVSASSPAAAAEFIRDADPDVVQVALLAIIDRTPQRALAF